MIAALIWKELREMAIFVATAVLVYAYFVLTISTPRNAANPFLDTSAVLGYLALGGAIGQGSSGR